MQNDSITNEIFDNIPIFDIIVRTDNICNEPLANTTRDNRTIDDSNERTDNYNINIYRYKFTTEFMDELFIFSKVHQYDHRKEFKQAWEEWIEDNENLIKNEVKRITELGYDGNILDKMYKSARYYFRKKSNEKKEPAKRRDYLSISKDLISSMDEHIQREIYRNDYKPSDAFEEFCKTNLDLLKEIVVYLCQNGLTNSEEIKKKIKKTYKNRYFLFIKK
jgi:hypothetical protein